MELLAAGQEKKALELLQYAADLDAQNPVYRAEAAMCRFRVHGDAASARGARRGGARRPALRPRLVLHGLDPGAVGSAPASGGEPAQGDQLMAPDRRPIDALKELTARKK
jgi:hypothetical protein